MYLAENRGEQHQPQLNTCKSSSFLVLFFLVNFSPPFLACSEQFKLVLIIAQFWCQECHPQGYKGTRIHEYEDSRICEYIDTWIHQCKDTKILYHFDRVFMGCDT